MKLTVLAALVAALSFPAAVSAQQAGQQPATTQQQPGTQQGTPRVYRSWSKLLAGINLSNDQHDKIQGLLDQYAQAHPDGSPRDRSAAKALREQIYGILTPDQQTQFKQTVQQLRAKRLAARQNHQQQYPQQQQQQYPQQQYPQPSQQPQNGQQPQWMQQHPEPAQTPI